MTVNCVRTFIHCLLLLRQGFHTMFLFCDVINFKRIKTVLFF